MVPDETGILLRDPTPQAIADALERLAADPELRARMGRAGAEYARRNFDPATNAHVVELLYDRFTGVETQPADVDMERAGAA